MLCTHEFTIKKENKLNVSTTRTSVTCLAAGPVVNLCLAGFVAAIRITSLLGMGMLRNTFVTSVCRFTMLHSPQSMQIKNAHAFRALLIVADENGNHMHVSPAAPALIPALCQAALFPLGYIAQPRKVNFVT